MAVPQSHTQISGGSGKEDGEAGSNGGKQATAGQTWEAHCVWGLACHCLPAATTDAVWLPFSLSNSDSVYVHEL